MIPWYFYALFYVIFKTIFQITRKEALEKTHAMSFESLRTIFVVIFACFLIPFMDFSFDLINLWWVYLASIFGTIGILFAAKAFKHGQISLISPLGNLRPGFVAILALIFLSETLRVKQIIGILIILISAYLLESDHNFSNFMKPIKHLFKSRYSIYFIFATFLFSITSILDKIILLNKINNIYTYFFFMWIFLAINFNIVHFFLYGSKDSIICLKKEKYWVPLVSFLSIIPNLLFLKAISIAPVSLVTPVLMLTTLLVVLLGGKFFHEKYLYFRLFTSLIMLIGTYLVIF